MLFIIYGLGFGGPELRLLDLARGLGTSMEVHVCVLGERLELLDELRAAGAHVTVLPMRSAWADWRQTRRLVRHVRDEGIGVVNTFDLKTLLVGAAVRMRLGRRVRLVHHVISFWDDLRPQLRLALGLAVRRADHVVCVAHALREGVMAGRPVSAPVSVIPNGVDERHYRSTPELREAARRRLGAAPDDVVLGTVANFRPVKNYPRLLRAAAAVLARQPRLRLVCVGGGGGLDEARALAARLGIADRVTFPGPVKDVREQLAGFDAFVLASLREGCPNVVLQAMAMGLPVAGAAVGEIPRLHDGAAAGLLFGPTDETAMTAAIERLVADASLRRLLARAGRERVEAEYGLTRMLDGYAALLRTEWERRKE